MHHLPFQGGAVDVSTFRTDNKPTETTSAKRLVGNTLRKVIRELDALVDNTEPGTPGRGAAVDVRYALGRAIESEGL